jgi:hypothetical protein
MNPQTDKYWSLKEGEIVTSMLYDDLFKVSHVAVNGIYVNHLISGYYECLPHYDCIRYATPEQIAEAVARRIKL